MRKCLEVFGNRDVQVATAGLIVSLLLLLNVPAEKQAQATVVLSGLWLFIGAVRVAAGYTAGKALEGTVPDGHRSVGGTNVYIGGEPPAADPKPPAAPGGGMKIAAVLLALCSLLFTSVACTGTSAPFQLAAQATGRNVVDEMRAFVTADATLLPSTKAERLAAVDRLEAATRDWRTIDLDEAAAAWDQLRVPYGIYIAGDRTLDAEQRATLAGIGTTFDRLIAMERDRLAALERRRRPPPNPTDTPYAGA